MCEFTTAAYVAAALAVAATAAQQVGAAQARKAETGAVQAEAERQRAIADRQMAATAQAQQSFEQPQIQAAQAKATGERETAYRAAAAPSITAYLPGQADAPQVVRDSVDQRRATDAGVLGAEAHNKAALEGWGDALLGGRIAIGRGAQEVAKQASFSQGSRNVLPSELAAAKYKGQGWRDLGTGLQIASQVVGMGGGSGAFAASGATLSASKAADSYGQGGWGAVLNGRDGGSKPAGV